MTEFIQEIERVEKTIQDNDPEIQELIQRNIDILHGYKLAPSFISLSNYQLAFIKLFELKYESQIYDQIEEAVMNELIRFYDDGRVYQEIRLQGIDIPEIGSESWQIFFEDETVDPLVHVYMKGWEFDHTALTG